eukprot:87985_1
MKTLKEAPQNTDTQPQPSINRRSSSSPKRKKYYQNQPNDDQKRSAYQSPIGILQRCIFHGSMHAFVVGSVVALYHLSYMSLDLVQDRTYRILNAPDQNKVDYWALLGAMFGLIYGKLVMKYDKDNDPFIRKSAFQKAVVPTRRMQQFGDDDELNNELKENYDELHKPSIYKTIFSFSWMNGELRHVISYGCIGICVGMTIHFGRTRNIVDPKRVWQYTTNCVGM